MGLSLRSIGRKITDIWDANSQEDQRKRLAAGQPRWYGEQQRQMGNPNVAERFVGAVSRAPVNVGRAVAAYTPIDEFASGTGHIMQRAAQAVAEVPDSSPFRFANNAVIRPFKTTETHAGQLLQGDNPYHGSGMQQAGQIGQDIINAASVVPVGRGVQGLAKGGALIPKIVKGAKVGAPVGTLFGTAQGVSTSLQNDINPLSQQGREIVAKNTGIGLAGGTVLGAGGPVLGAGLKAGGKVAVKGTNATVKGVKVTAMKTAEAVKPSLTALDQSGKLQLPKIFGRNPDSSFHYTAPTPGVTTYRGKAQDVYKQLTNLGEGGYARIPGREKPRVEAKVPDVPEVPDRIPMEVTNKNTVRGEFQRAMVDKDAPLINYLKDLDRQDGGTRVQQFYYDTGLQRRSNAIANTQLENSQNLNKALGGLKGQAKKEFDTYAAARNEVSNAEKGLPTTRPVEELQATVSALEPKHGERFGALNKFYGEWADRMHDAGLIDDATHTEYKSNPDYSRIQRDMSDLANPRGRAGNSYSLGTTMARQKRTGSQRDIQPADLTAFKYAQEVQKEIQKNQTATNLIDVLAEQGVARKVSDTTRKNTISRIVGGKTEVWEVPMDIKEIADNISPYQLGVLARIVSFPQRLLRAGATGLSLPFTAANYVKDQVSSAAMSKDAAATHMPLNIATGLYQSAKDFGIGTNDPLWQKFAEHLGDTTQYDFIRNVKNAKQLSREVRLGQAGRAVNKAGHPIRTLEDLNQITEKATRFQNFKGVYKQVLKDTKSEAEATKQATLAAWQNSTDFSRMGHVGQALNLLIPYFNAGIQGTRLLGRRLAEAPAATTAKITTLVGIPLAGITLHNLTDEKTREVYNNISDYEKQNNIIMVLPNAKQQKDGSYSGVIKVPLQPGLTNLVQPVRHAVEAFAHANQADVPKMAQEFMKAWTGPLDITSPSAALGSVIPQAAKPIVQQAANRDFFTGKQIVPDYINEATTASGEKVPESKKAYPFTSGTSQITGKLINKSPIRIEKFVKDTSGKIGQYSENAIDTALASKGLIPREQIGGVSLKEDVTRRFARAQGKVNFQKSEGAKHFDRVKQVTKGLNVNEQAAYNALHPNTKNFLGERIYEHEAVYDPAARLDAYNRFPKVFEADKKMDSMGRKEGKPGNPLFDLEKWQVKKVLEKENLPPGAKDPELSNLRDKDWFADYSIQKSKFFGELKKRAEKDGKPFAKSDNPYPDTPDDLQKIMDSYNSLSKGTGARSAWIKSNPGQWGRMQKQFAMIDNWQNIARGKRGLDATEGDTGIAAGYGDSSGGGFGGYARGGGRGGGRGSSGIPNTGSAYKYAVSLKAGGTPKKVGIKTKAGKGRKVAQKGSGGKPKVSLKKSRV